MEKLLITGGCGFVGTNLIAFLSQQNAYELSVLDDLVVGKAKNLS